MLISVELRREVRRQAEAAAALAGQVTPVA